MDTQTAFTSTSEVRQQNKKCVTTKLPSQNEQQHTFHLPERNRSNSHFQFSTKLTYAPLLKTKKPFIHPSPISLCPSNEVFTLDTLEEMSFLSETEDDYRFFRPFLCGIYPYSFHPDKGHFASLYVRN